MLLHLTVHLWANQMSNLHTEKRFQPLQNFFERMVVPRFLSTGSLCLDIHVSVEIIFAGSPCFYLQETLTFVDFYIVMHS